MQLPGRLLLAATLATVLFSIQTARAQELPPPDEPRSWIPDRQAPKGGLTARVDPPLSERERQALEELNSVAPDKLAPILRPGTGDSMAGTFAGVGACIADATANSLTRANQQPAPSPPQIGRGTHSRTQFLEAYRTAEELVNELDFEGALAAIDRASLHTGGDPLLELSLERVRVSAFTGLDNLGAVALSLERQLALGVLPGTAIEATCERIGGLHESIRRRQELLEPR